MTRAARVMPMFPLGTVLFPHALLPLHVFEPRYRLMTQRVLRRRRRVRGRAHRARERSRRRRHPLRRRHRRARRAGAQELPDGGYALATVGIRRVQVDAVAGRRSVSAAEVVDARRSADGTDADAEATRACARAHRRARRRVRAATAGSTRASPTSRRSTTTRRRRRTRWRRSRRSVRSTRSGCSRPARSSDRLDAARGSPRRARARRCAPTSRSSDGPRDDGAGGYPRAHDATLRRRGGPQPARSRARNAWQG